MTEENPKTREEWILQTNTNRADALALAQQGRNELIELAWETYGAARAQAGAIYEATEKDIELVFQSELAAIEVGYGPENQELDVSLKTPEREAISARIDEITDWKNSIAELSGLADDQARSDGERRIIGDGLLALQEIVLEMAIESKRRAEQMQAITEKGGNTDEVNEGGG